jgi:sentrin-specific protease 1
MLSHLEGNTWFNIDVIDRYMEALQERQTLLQSRNEHQGMPNCLFLNVNFFATAETMDVGIVKSWFGVMDVVAGADTLDLVFVPVHQGTGNGSRDGHWSLALINLRDERFEYYCSLQWYARGRQVLTYLKRLVAVLTDVQGRLLWPKANRWPFVYRKDLPRQSNGYDCGPFVCMVTERMSVGLPVLSQADTERLYRDIMRQALAENEIDRRLPFNVLEPTEQATRGRVTRPPPSDRKRRRTVATEGSSKKRY